MAIWSRMGLLEGAGPFMEQLGYFHDLAMGTLGGVLGAVSVGMFGSIFDGGGRDLLENMWVESAWTVLPAGVLVVLGWPSLHLLYLLDESSGAEMTLKVVGHQWYWSYEYSGFEEIMFDSYMVKDGLFRLLEVDNRVILPYGSEVRALVTGGDVIHSWSVPSLGVKGDAIPGRLNQLNLVITNPGVYVGQCSEICGANHSFMPIILEAVKVADFFDWAKGAAS